MDKEYLKRLGEYDPPCRVNPNPTKEEREAAERLARETEERMEKRRRGYDTLDILVEEPGLVIIIIDHNKVKSLCGTPQKIVYTKDEHGADTVKQLLFKVWPFDKCCLINKEDVHQLFHRVRGEEDLAWLKKKFPHWECFDMELLKEFLA